MTYGEKQFYSEIRNYKEKELPKLDEKKFSDYFKDFNVFQGLKVAAEMNRESNYTLSGWEKFGYMILGSLVKQD